MARKSNRLLMALMVPFVMVVFDELVNRPTQRTFAHEDQPIQARFLNRPHEALRVRVEIWRPGWQAKRLDTGGRQCVSKRVGEAWIAIMQEEAFPAEASIIRIGELATALDHPGTVRLREDAANLHPSRREVDHEQDGEAGQPSHGPVHCEEIRGREDASMRAQELVPGRPLLPLRSGFDPVLLQNVGDGASADVVIQVGERTLNPGIAPRSVLGHHTDDPLADRLRGAWPSRAATQVSVVLARDQRPVPCKQGVGCHDRPDLRQRTSTKRLGFRGQADALIVGESEPTRSELLP
jgi:hypothetical protein